MRRTGCAHATPRQAAAKRYDVAVVKARDEFSKAVDAAAQIYVERKDTVSYETLLREKQRFLSQKKN